MKRSHLQEVNLFDAILPCLGINHVKYLYLLESDHLSIHRIPSTIHYTELTLTNLLLNLQQGKLY